MEASTEARLSHFNSEVKAILTRHGVMYRRLGDELGMTRSTFYKRLQGLHAWRFGEVLRIHEYLRRFEPELTLDRLLGVPVRDPDWVRRVAG